jgi:hypothetical protein
MHWWILGFDSMAEEIPIIAIWGVFGPAVAFAAILGLNTITAPARMQADVERQADNLQSTLSAIQNKQDHINTLSRLLSDGIHHIWNGPVSDDDDRAALQLYWEEWCRRIIEYLTLHFSEADVIHFSRLGVVPLVERAGAYDSQHKKILREYALKEQRLREIIRDNRP